MFTTTTGAASTAAATAIPTPRSSSGRRRRETEDAEPETFRRVCRWDEGKWERQTRTLDATDKSWPGQAADALCAVHLAFLLLRKGEFRHTFQRFAAPQFRRVVQMS